MKIVDLHTHSNHSDGSLSPSEVILQAQAKGVAAIALTDHETVSGLAEAAAEAQKLGIGFLPGMEMTVDFSGRKLHVLALGFAIQHPSFQDIYKKIRYNKEKDMDKVIGFIRAAGVAISPDLVDMFVADRLDRYAVMRYLGSLHLCDRAQPLWDKYINPAIDYLGLDVNVTAAEALPAIHEAGGITSLAHFHKKLGLQGLSREQQESAIKELAELGLDGMERWYPSYTEEDASFAGAMIAKYGLLCTGGTDFHGKNRPGIEIGTGWQNNMSVPYSVYEKILLATVTGKK